MIGSVALAALFGGVSGASAAWITFRLAGGARGEWKRWGAAAAVFMAILAVMAQRRLHWSIAFAIAVLQLGVLIHVAIHDARRQMVLNAVTYPGAALSLLVAPLSPGLTLWSALAGAAFAAAPFLVVATLRPGGVGMGDVKLAVMVGMMAGIWPGFRVIAAVGGALAVALLGAGFLLLTRRATAQTALPFGTFLALAAMPVLAVMNP